MGDGASAVAVLEQTAPVVETPSDAGTGGREVPPKQQNQQPEPKSATPPTEQEKQDRRQNPDALRKWLKAQRDAGPEHAERVQEVERALGENKSFKTVWPTVREARDAKAALDAVGGTVKIAELQASATASREIDEMLEAGDPAVVDKILETGPKGLVKLLPAMIDKLAALDGPGVSAAIQPHIFGYLEAQGMPAAIDAMVEAFNAGKPDEAKAVLAKIINWYKASAVGKPGAKTDAPPEQAAWEKEREQFHVERFSGEVSKAFEAAMSHAEKEIDRELGAQGKEYGLTPEVLTVIRADVWKRIEKERNADPLFKSTIASKVNERSRKVDASTADYLKSQVDSRVKDAVRQELRVRYGFIKAKPAPDPNKKADVTAAPAGGTVSIDYSKTIAKFGSRGAAEDAILRGNAVNSAGKPIKKVGKLWQIA